MKPSQIFEYDWRKCTDFDKFIELIQEGSEAVQFRLKSIEEEEGESLNLTENEIIIQDDDKGIQSEWTEENLIELLGVLEENITLRALSLSKSHLSSTFLEKLFREDNYPKLKGLEYLDLSKNESLSELSLCNLIGFVKQSPHLLHLDLSYCSLSDSVGNKLVDFLENNRVLRSLNLDGNDLLTTNIVQSFFETVAENKTLVSLSMQGTFCKIRKLKKVFSVLKKNQQILYLGFPTFFRSQSTIPKRGSTNSIENDLSLKKKNCVSFKEKIIQKNLGAVLKENYSLVKIFNAHGLKKGNRDYLTRNLNLMKNGFNSVLVSAKIPNKLCAEKQVLFMGRTKSGKTELMRALFGKDFTSSFKEFELEISEKKMFLETDEDLNTVVREMPESSFKTMSIKYAAQALARKGEKLKDNEKFVKLSQVVRTLPSLKNIGARDPTEKRHSRARSRMSKKRRNSTFDSTRQESGNIMLANFAKRQAAKKKKKNKKPKSVKSKTDEFDEEIDEAFGDIDVEEDAEDSVEETAPLRLLRPNMSKTEIVEAFDSRVMARFGMFNTDGKVLITATELSMKSENSLKAKKEKSRNMRGTMASMKSLHSQKSGTASGIQSSEADQYGEFNSSLIDLANLTYGIRESVGVLVVCFSIAKLLKYIKLEDEKMLINNPITNYIKTLLKSTCSQTTDVPIFLVGTASDRKRDFTAAELKGVQTLLSREISSKFLRRLVRSESTAGSLCFFPVDSTSSQKESVNLLRNEIGNKIFKLVKKKSPTKKKVKNSVLLRWLRARDVLQMHRKNPEYNFVSKQKLKELIRDCEIVEQKEVDEFLSYLVSLNEVLYFPTIDILKNFVVLNKSFFFFSVYQIINRRYLIKLFSSKQFKSEIKYSDLVKDLSLFKSKKLLSRDLIELVWKKQGLASDQENYFDDNRVSFLYMLELMRKTLFVTEWKNLSINMPLLTLSSPLTKESLSKTEVSDIFVVPSLVKKVPEPLTKKERIRNIKSFSEKVIKERRIANSMFSTVHTLERQNSIQSSGKSTVERKKKKKKRKKRGKKKEGSKTLAGDVITKTERTMREVSPSNSDSLKATLPRTESKKKIQSKVLPEVKVVEDENEKTFNSQRIEEDIKNLETSMKNAAKRGRRFIGSTQKRGKYILDRSKPVSVLLDFKEMYMPSGFFLRLCSALFGLITKKIKQSSKGFDKSIEAIELKQNRLKITFDRKVSNCEEDVSDVSTLGGVSACGSEMESKSAVNVKLSAVKGQNGKEYLMLFKTKSNDSIVFVVRDHDLAPKYLGLLDKAVKSILPQQEVPNAVNPHICTFYKLDLHREHVKVEVKNNKYIGLESALKKKFAPWFAKNKRVNRD